MKKRFLGYLVITGILALSLITYKQNPPAKSFLPHLPYPIAREKALVTPIGQGAEGLVVGELCDALNINSNFMFWAEPRDLEGYNSLVLVLGFSKQGLYSMHKTPAEEISRSKALARAAREKNIPVILIHAGGQDRRGTNNDTAAGSIAWAVDYMIVTEDGERDGFFNELAAFYKTPITVVSDIKAMKVPFNSVFR